MRLKRRIWEVSLSEFFFNAFYNSNLFHTFSNRKCSVQSNSLFSKETDKQIEGHIKEFLKYANDRLHKKNK